MFETRSPHSPPACLVEGGAVMHAPTRHRAAQHAPPTTPDDDGQLRQEPSRRRPNQDIPLTEAFMASTTLTLPADKARPAATQSFGSAHGTILALDLGTTTGWALRT